MNFLKSIPMRHVLSLLLSLVVTTAGSTVAIAAPSPHEVTSPNGNVTARVTVNALGRAELDVTAMGEKILLPSPLGVTVDGMDLGQNVQLGDAETYSIDETFPWMGSLSTAENKAKGIRISVITQGAKDQAPLHWQLNVRAANRGAAWRYNNPGKGKRVVKGEATS